MARRPAPDPAPKPWSLAWKVLLVGLALSAIGWFVSRSQTTLPDVLPMAALFTGSLLVGVAVLLQLRQETWLWPTRVESAALVSLAGLAAMAGYLAMQPGWISGHMFYAAAFLLALLGSVLILLPQTGRRMLLSVVVLFHFGGMVTSATAIDPPNGSAPWLVKQAWMRVYRPYLSFLYMTNAYHFYSPDPGPPELFWFAVMYDDGSYTWVKMPSRANSPNSMHYQRMLALPQHTFQAIQRLPLTNAELIANGSFAPERGSWEEIYLRRELGSTWEFGPKRLPIPMVIDVDASWQYKEPTETSRKLVASVAKRVFWTAPPAKDEAGTVREDVKVKSVKFYRVVHQILTPHELAKGVSPIEKPKHWAYFVGEYDGFGQLVDEKDPFLYWYLPILIVPDDFPRNALMSRPGVPAVKAREHAPKDGFLLDCLEMHAAGRRKAKENNK